jgi:ferredoxin
MTERRHDAALRVMVDEATCIGSGSCVRLARGAFALDADGTARVVDPASAGESRIRLAERSCPTGAIFVSEDGG